jgi:hypothetical protein
MRPDGQVASSDAGPFGNNRVGEDSDLDHGAPENRSRKPEQTLESSSPTPCLHDFIADMFVRKQLKQIL